MQQIAPMKHNPLHYLFFVVLVLSMSCSQTREDHSLSIEEYMKLGVPDPTRKWDLEDYKQANNTLVQLKWQRPFVLPVKGSKKSGLLFDHMISFEYLSFLRDTTLSLNAKAERISEFVRVYDYWEDVYSTPILKESPYQRERLALRVFHLRLMEEMLNLMHKINKSDDPADIALQYGHKFIVNNYLTSLKTSLEMQRNAPDFLKPELDQMADSIYASVIRNREWMNSGILNELNGSLRAVIDSTTSDYVRGKYEHLKLSGVDTDHMVSEKRAQ